MVQKYLFCEIAMSLCLDIDLEQMPHCLAVDLSLHCLPMTLYGIQGKIGLTSLQTQRCMQETGVWYKNISSVK